MSRIVVATVVLVAAMVRTPALAEVPTPEDMTLRSCLLSGVNYEDSAERMVEEDHDEEGGEGGWVPSGYALMPADRSREGSAVVMIWTFSCAGEDVAPSDDVDLTIVGVALEYTDPEDPTKWPNVVPDWPGNWGIYVVDIFTDSAMAASWLRRAGMPAVVRPITFDEDYLAEVPSPPSHEVEDVDTCNQSVGDAPGIAHSPPDALQGPEVNKRTTVSVYTGDTAFETTTNPHAHHNVVTHCHSQVLRHGPYGSPGVRLEIPVARDHFCQQPMPECGTATATSGRVAEFLGGDGSRDDPVLAFDHERIDTVRFATM